jgi:hypothetical protein
MGSQVNQHKSYVVIVSHASFTNVANQAKSNHALTCLLASLCVTHVDVATTFVGFHFINIKQTKLTTTNAPSIWSIL